MDDNSAGLLHGRRVIYTDVDTITPENVLSVLQKARAVHVLNKRDIEFLWGVFRGHQAISRRTKEVRPEICNKICENRASEIVTFKTGYFLGEPVQYVAATADAAEDNLKKFNAYINEIDKPAKDHDLLDWMHIAGTGFRLVLPNADDEYESPFDVSILDPRYSFVVYHSSPEHKPVMGVYYVVKDNGDQVYSVYTKDSYYEIVNDDTMQCETHLLGGIPIIEYPLNTARMGSFEVVLPLLDAINLVDSNRVDAVEQFVQALMLFHNVDIDEESFAALRASGAIKYRDIDAQMKAEISYITAELKQGETQTLLDHLYQVVLTICGMPNRNGGSSTSDTGSAVIMRDGWSDAEARAKNTELKFKMSEKQFLRVALRICKYIAHIDIKLMDIEIRLPRANHLDVQSKAQVLTTMLSRNDIHPLLAFTHSNMFPDAQLAYSMSMSYKEEQEKNALEQQEKIMQNAKQEGENGTPDTTGSGGNRKAVKQDGASGAEG